VKSWTQVESRNLILNQFNFKEWNQLVKSWTQVESRNLILNQFNFKEWNYEKKISILRTLKRKEDNIKKKNDQTWQKKIHKGWNYKRKSKNKSQTKQIVIKNRD
jgi:hypothetical protein